MVARASSADSANPPKLSAFGAALMSRRGMAAAAVLIVATALVFGLEPDLDLAVAGLFYAGGHHFIGQGGWGEVLRRLFYWAPFAITAIMLGLYVARRAGRRLTWAPNGRGIIFLVVSLGLGPGLLVNVILKDHSHRPRPIQVADFGGTLSFRPFYRLDGDCKRNCSFVSGEGSAGFWTMAPALLAPASAQPLALAGALIFGTAAALLRIAFGGHFLSDTIFAALFTWVVVAASWHALFRRE